jgi:Na+-translocating ferredoxin:NAD+ oxidoreductase RnfG subunit
VVDAVNEAAGAGEAAEATAEPEAKEAEADAKTAVKDGFAGPVAVQVTLNEDGSIKSLSVGNEEFKETVGLGAKAQDDEFTSQFVGKMPPLALRKADEEASASTIDAIAAATITSQAVVDAVNEAIGPAAPVVETPEVYTAEAPGYDSPVEVEVSFTADNKIAQLKIGDDRFKETPGLGARVQDEDFIGQFIGKGLPIAMADIDAVTGATLTTQAVIDAINLAYEAYQGAAAPESDETKSEEITVTKQGFESPVTVKVAFNADGSIKELTVGDEQFKETVGLGAKARDDEFTSQFAGKVPPLALRKADEEATASTIDALTGATVTSQAVVDAINEAFEQFSK